MNTLEDFFIDEETGKLCVDETKERRGSGMKEFAEMVKELQQRLKNAGGGTIIITEDNLQVKFGEWLAVDESTTSMYFSSKTIRMRKYQYLSIELSEINIDFPNPNF